MLDVLPKLAVLERAGIALDDINCFIVNCNSEFQVQTLAHLGIHQDRICRSTAEQSITAERLLIPYVKHDLGDRIYHGLGLGIAHWVPDWLKKSFATKTDSPAGVPPPAHAVERSAIEPLKSSADRLYISRAVRGSRTMKNETELATKLEARGFRVLTLESFSVPEQAQFMQDAAVVVAPHGAGLTNIAFCKPGTLIVELFGDFVVPCYWSLSTLAKLEYRQYLSHEAMLQGASSASSATPKTSALSLAERRALGIELNVDDFLNNLDRWLAESTQAQATSANRKR